jgi:hypothetical protein
MFKRITIATVILFLALGLNAYAQKKTTSLAGKGGIGAQVGGEATIGAHGFFYFSNQMAIGAHFGFIFDGGTGEGSSTALLFAPYFNYYITKLTNTLWFYGQGVFAIKSGSYMEYDPNSADYVRVSSTGTALNINAGLEWRVTSLTNIYGGVGFINFDLDPSRFKIGVMKPFIGLNWIIF